METEIVATDKGWKIRTGKKAWLDGVHVSFVKAQEAERAYIQRSLAAREKSKERYKESK